MLDIKQIQKIVAKNAYKYEMSPGNVEIAVYGFVSLINHGRDTNIR